MSPTAINGTALRELRGALSGTVLEPSDDGYDEARTIRPVAPA